ncbi:MAG: pentapeptide repeat-containing protein [Marinoscillum sp.]|uniref:pentapeptide repeat-containing protein n=1 Tax=Marinoscillum sp. TaxID=2024838 RepID=UPI0032F6BA4F
MEDYFEEQVFNGVNFTEQRLDKGEYNLCRFVNCSFSGVDLSYLVFSECVFENCDLSNARMNSSSWKEVQFNECKLLGLIFSDCNPFLIAMNFRGCQLNFSSFYQLNLKGSKFEQCSLHEVDFTETNLTGASFYQSDLSGAIFENTILEKSDFRSAQNYALDPELNKLKKAKFSMPEVVGLLHKLDIHIS